ncbi:hypothetical protein [Dactylosporangium sp. NPDC049140]|uniref:hypothetical protein n=1 Tax=Dactylosporangium sp. NPDC049140 TaxID=3155647 RepID=UPI003411C2E2
MTAPLEARYERLLRVYPAAFRRVHGEDMLTTMLADAGEGRRWPRPGDAADILFHALRQRLFRRPGGGLLDSGWSDACALLGPVLAVVLATLRLTAAARRALSGLSSQWATPPHVLNPGATVLLLAGAWALVAAAAFAGRRRIAAGLGWVALLIEAVTLLRRFPDDPVAVVYGLWWLALGLVATVALTAAGPRRPGAVAGRWRLAVLLAAPAVIGAVLAVGGSGLLIDYTRGGYNAFYLQDLPGLQSATSGWGLEGADATQVDLMLLAILVAVVAGSVAVARLPGPVRRRMLVAVAPVATLAALVELGFNGWAVSNVHMGHNIPLVAGQWASLVLLPLLVFLLGLWWVRRRDETMRLAALGAAAERERN